MDWLNGPLSLFRFYLNKTLVISYVYKYFNSENMFVLIYLTLSSKHVLTSYIDRS